MTTFGTVQNQKRSRRPLLGVSVGDVGRWAGCGGGKGEGAGEASVGGGVRGRINNKRQNN